MGDIKRILFNEKTQDPLLNKRFTIELCENVHLHYRNLRLEFPKEEFLLIFKKLKALKEQEIEDFHYGDNVKFLIYDEDLPDKTEFNDRFQVEEQVNGQYHIHYKNIRLEFRKDFDGLGLKDLA